MAGSTEIKEEYTSSLQDLTFNSKPLIIVLTMLAEENIAHAKDIVEAIETHLSRVRTEVKLPVLYLIDSIIKNVGGPYTALFCQNIVSTFCSTFEKVDEATRAEMFKLRQTWNDVILPKKLYVLDVQITQLDPAWPVTAPPPSSIHFNPKFLKTMTTTVPGCGTSTSSISKPSTNALMSTTNTAGLDPNTLIMQQKLINKQKELLELQQRKVQLELLQTQVKLQEQQLLQNVNTLGGTNSKITSRETHSQNLLLKPEVAKQLSVSTVTNKNSNTATNSKPKTGTHIITSTMNSKVQNHISGGPRIAPVNSNLANARPIRDPRLLRHLQQHQQQFQQQQPHILSIPVNSNVHLESKSKSGTQVTVESDDNKIVNNKTSVRNDRIELRLVNNKGNIESHGKSKTLPHSSPLKHTQKIGSSIRKTSKFSRDSKASSSSLSDLADSKNSSSSLASPIKNNRSDLSAKIRSLSRSPNVKSKKKSALTHSNKDSSVSRSMKDKLLSSSDKDGSAVYDKSSALFRMDSAVNRVDKKSSDKHSRNIKSEKESKLRKSEATSFKNLKGSTKNRNYIRRNRNTSVSPEASHDVDLRLGGPPEKQPRIQDHINEEKNGSVDETIQNMDVDLRQLPAIIGKKRPSTESGDSPNAKKNKSEIFDELFGSEDIDLRPLPPVLASPTSSDRPPTPPPPIISEKIEKTKTDSPNTKERKELKNKKEVPSKNTNLDALRAKLANAVIQDKLKEPKELGDVNNEGAKKLKLQVDTDMRKLPSFANHPDASRTKIIISPADEESIKAGNMTKAQEKALMNKIIAQIETQKLREAQRKESESIGNISLQPISDDEFDVDFSGSESGGESPRKGSNFGDKDDRIYDDHMIEDRIYDDHMTEDRHKDERIMEDRIPVVGPQINLLEETYPKYPKMSEHRDPRRGRPWRGRQRKTWESVVPPVARPGIRPFRPVPEPWVRPVNEPWRSMGPPMYPNNFGSNSNNPDIPALEYAHPDSYKFITIDSEPREIRYYDETAIVFMNASDPREITFHNGTRRIFFDGEPYILKFNSPYEEISIKGNIHRVRLGAPSREIFIDGKGYECYFDQNEKIIDLDGNKIVVKLEPPPPQVKIGQEKPLDLVAGKVQLVVDAKNMFTVFLDAKPQTFEIDGVSHTLKFIDSLHAVLINDTRFEVEFGGLPKPVLLYDKKHFVRFSVLPKGIKPGHINIKGMETSQYSGSPKNDTENSQDGHQQTPYSFVEPVSSISKKRPFEGDSPERNSNSPQQLQNLLQHQNYNNLDMLSSVMASSMLPTTNEGEGGYSVEKAATSEIPSDTQSNNPVAIPPVAPKEPAVPSVLNINDLFQRLVATGIVTTASVSQPEELPPASPPKFNKNSNNKNLKPVLFGKPETLKVRRPPLIQSLYTGMQCSSCGMRFPPEQSMHYSQHLDWHFRQNRKGKKNIRKATSRRWYYSLSDWNNYEEIEDLEEREKSYFENQQQNQSEGNNEEGEEEIEIPCVPADPKIQDAACEMCRDKFEQFYNEEKDEWQLRMAIRVDDKTYHPLCYEDYQASFVDVSLEENKFEAILEKDNDSHGIPGLEITDSEIQKEENKPDTEDDDDVMEVIENIDDEESPPVLEKEDQNTEAEADADNEGDHDNEDDDDVIINEIVPERIILDDDDKDDYIPSDCLIPGIVIKEEPIDDGFVDVEGGLVKTKEIKIKTEPIDNDEAETVAAEVNHVPETADTTHTEVVSSIDGNVEFDSGMPAATTGISGKIKINITKPIPTIVPKESKDVIAEELKSDCIDPTQPLPPGEEPVLLNVKPSLQGLDLKRQPIVRKGSELTGLCSIM